MKYNQWINVKDEMPDTFQKVDVWVVSLDKYTGEQLGKRYTDIIRAERCGSGLYAWCDKDEHIGPVTHFMRVKGPE